MKSKIIKAKETSSSPFTKGEAYINIEGNVVVLCVHESSDDEFQGIVLSGCVVDIWDCNQFVPFKGKIELSFD